MYTCLVLLARNWLFLRGSSGEYSAQFYVGPKDQEKLESLAEYLDLTVDYGFLWMLAKPIFAAMKFIHEVVGNWGWAIILLTIGIKILLYPLSAASLRSMAKMRSLQPKMERLKETYGDDRQKMSQELMGLYKKEKVNPAGGCFPHVAADAGIPVTLLGAFGKC